MAIYCIPGSILPVIDINYCNPTITGDEINHIAFTVRGKGFGTTPTATEWNDRVSNSDPLPTSPTAPNDDYPIRVLNVTGSKPETEYTETEISLGRIIREIDKTTIEFEIDEVSISMYEMMRSYQNSKLNLISAWYFTKDRTYGGNDGAPAQLTMGFVLGGDRKGQGKIKGKIVWKTGEPTAIETLTGLDFIS
jgi:hypothetical protein